VGRRDRDAEAQAGNIQDRGSRGLGGETLRRAKVDDLTAQVRMLRHPPEYVPAPMIRAVENVTHSRIDEPFW
jgi:hypothetical protein